MKNGCEERLETVTRLEHSFPVAAVTNHRRLSGLKQQIYSLTAVKVRGLKSRCVRGTVRLEASGGVRFFTLLDFGGSKHSLAVAATL